LHSEGKYDHHLIIKFYLGDKNETYSLLIEAKDIKQLHISDVQLIKASIDQNIGIQETPEMRHYLSAYQKWDFIARLKRMDFQVKLSIGTEILMYNMNEVLQLTMDSYSMLEIDELDIGYILYKQMLPSLDKFFGCFEEIRVIKIKVGELQVLLGFFKLIRNMKIFQIEVEYLGPTYGIGKYIKEVLHKYFSKKIVVK
jgi:hypothetical protein